MSETERSIPERVSKTVEEQLTYAEHGGVVVGVVEPGGVHTTTSGTLWAGGPEPTEHTLFELGELSMVFTTTLLAEMVVRGEVGLHDPVNRYLPKEAQIRSFRGREITHWHLATHTSGFPGWIPEFPYRHDDENPFARYGAEELHRSLSTYRLPWGPGTEHQSSRIAIGALGYALTRMAGKRFEELLQERVCGPLGMTDTRVTFTDDELRRMAQGHLYDSGKPVPTWTAPALPGAVGLRSTMVDMLKFLQANADPASTPLRPAIELAQTVQIVGKYRLYQKRGCMSWLTWLGLGLALQIAPNSLGFWMRAAVTALGALLVFRLIPPRLEPMALGWRIDTLSSGEPYRHESGQTGGFSCYIAIVPQTRTGVVVLRNSSMGVSSVGAKVLEVVQPPKPGG